MALTPWVVSEEWAATPWKSTRMTLTDLWPRTTRMLVGSPTIQPRGFKAGFGDGGDQVHTPRQPTSSS